jgi:ATP-dependent Lon protease
MGLGVTEMGGLTLPVEVVTMVGKGDLMVTGQLGDVMRESAMAALSYIRTRAKELHIDPNFQDTTDLHIHLPDNALPKDGPSAGITIATALVSALTHRAVRNNLAMTGEVTLLGSVLPIGGLKEKVLAAQQANITYLIIPAENKKELAEIPAKIRQRVHFILVDNMDQVIDAALLPEEPGDEKQETINDEPVPLRLDERLTPTHHESHAHRSGISADEQSANEGGEGDSSTFLRSTSETDKHSSYPSARSKRDSSDPL